MIDSNYDQSRVIAQIGPNNETTWYTYGKGLIGQEDETGKVTDRFTYTAYGELVDHTGNTDVIF